MSAWSDRIVSRAAILAMVAGLSCDFVTDPPLPPDAKRFVPPPVYARWWAMVESCSRVERPLRDVEWFAAPGPLHNPDNSGEFVQGYWSRASNRIVLVSDDTISGRIVRHEMLHALVRIGGHPRSEFLQNCGGVVNCSEECIRDGGPVTPPDAATLTVAPSELEVTSTVTPATPGSSLDGGLFSLTITVRNPFPHPVVALLPPRPPGGTPVSYSFDIRSTINGSGALAGDLALDAGVTYFAAGETKRDVFDFAVATGGFTPSSSSSASGVPGQWNDGVSFAPGTYTFRGAYGDHWAPDLTVDLRQ